MRAQFVSARWSEPSAVLFKKALAKAVEKGELEARGTARFAIPGLEVRSAGAPAKQPSGPLGTHARRRPAYLGGNFPPGAVNSIEWSSRNAIGPRATPEICATWAAGAREFRRAPKWLDRLVREWGFAFAL